MQESKDGTHSNHQKIIDAATRLVMDQGVKGTSLAAVAREAGISKGTLYYYFPAKDDLIYELTEQHFDRIASSLLERVDTMKGASLQSIMHECLTTLLMAEDRGRLNLYLLQESVIENEALRRRFRQTYQYYRMLMKKFMEIVYPSLSAENRETLSTLFVGLVDGLIIQWLLDPEAISIDNISTLLAGLHLPDSMDSQ